MKAHTPSWLGIFSLLIISLFAIAVVGSAIPNATTSPIDSPLLPLLKSRGADRDPPDCGSSPFQQPCSSASSLHLPFRSVFKLPATIINVVAPRARQVSAVTLPAISDFKRQGNGLLIGAQGRCHGFFQMSRKVSSGLGVSRFPNLSSLVVKGLIMGARRIAAHFIPLNSYPQDKKELPASRDLDVRAGPLRDPPHCGKSPSQRPCSASFSAASSLRVPRIFKLPTLFLTTLTTVRNAIVFAAPAFDDYSHNAGNISTVQDIEVREPTEKYCRYNSNDIDCGAQGAGSSLRVPSIFSVPPLIFNVIRSIPSVMASAIPSENKQRAEPSILLPSVELGRLSRSITPSISSIQSLLPHKQRDENLTERGYPDYCHCNEDGCWDSPDCCANGTCYVAPTLQNEAPRRRALEAAWVGVLAMSIIFARAI